VARRLAAAAIDLALVPLVVVTAAELAWRTGVLRLLGVTPATWTGWSWSFTRVAWTVAAAAFAYHAVAAARWGRTVGKLVAGLRVESGAGTPVGPWRALWRASWNAAVYLPSVLAPLLAMAACVAVAVGDRRSPGDRAAGTRVV
jgi:uncharacterized RDD family membrane protein YckC